MAVKISTISCETAVGVAVQHLFFHDADHQKLLIIMPGRGYTTEHPALYYLRSGALELGYDVLSIQYSFQAAPERASAENMLGALQDEIVAGIEALPRRDYAEISFAGKSLGSPYAPVIAQGYGTAQTRLLLLTPVSNAAEQSQTYPTLCIIGTNDYFYKQDPQIAQTGSKNVQWRVYEGLNHSLEFENDWQRSLTVLSTITRTCCDFLRDGRLKNDHTMEQ